MRGRCEGGVCSVALLSATCHVLCRQLSLSDPLPPDSPPPRLSSSPIGTLHLLLSSRRFSSLCVCEGGCVSYLCTYIYVCV